MKKKFLLSAALMMNLISNTVFAQTVAWTQSYESRNITYPGYSLPSFTEEETKVRADYNYSGDLFVAGTDISGQIKINKIDPATGVVLASHTEINVYATTSGTFAAYNPGVVVALKVFRHSTLTNYVYVFGKEYDGWSYDIVLMQYDAGLNLLNKRNFGGGPTANPSFLEVDPVNGNPVISYSSGSASLKRLTLTLGDQWTRTLTTGYNKFLFCPTNSWMVLISSVGIKRITADNITAWTIATPPATMTISNFDIDNSGNIFIASRSFSVSNIRKYNQKGDLVFNNSNSILNISRVNCKADNTGGVFFTEETNYLAYYSTELHYLKRFSSTGALMFNQYIPASSNLVINVLEFVNGNVFIAGYHKKSTPLSPTSVDTSVVYKYTASGFFVYRDAFTIAPGPTFSPHVGIYNHGVAKFGTEITIVGEQFEAPTSTTNINFSWYLRKYGPVARMANSSIDQFAGHSNSVTAYPNPTAGNVRISSESEINEINIYDLTGRLVKSLEVDYLFETDLDVSSLKPGVYMLNVASREKLTSIKFVKE